MKNARRFLMYGIPKSLLFKIILFLLILLIGKNVFAQNVTSSIRCGYNLEGGTYYGDPNDGYNRARCYDTGTRYSPQLGYLEFYLPTSAMSFTATKSYTVTMNMATNDWRNNIMIQNVRYINSSGGVITTSGSLPTISNYRFISRKQIKFDITLPSGTVYPYLRFVISSTTYANPDPDISSSKFITGETNWLLSSVDVTPVSSSSGSSGGSSGGSTTIFDDTGIIDNANQNTTDIINNNNSNTQEIIDNENNINFTCGNSRKVNFTSMVEGSYIADATGRINSNSNFYVSNYIYVKPNNTYTINFNDITGLEYGYLCWYNNEDLISCSQYRNMSGYASTNFNITSPSNANKLKVTIRNNSNANIIGYICTNNQQDNTNAINDINDTLNNDNVDSGTGADFFNDFNTSDNGGISGIITKPLVLINSLLSNNDSCSPLNFSITFPGLEPKSVSFPSGCILWNEVPSTVINIYQIFIVGFSSYYLLKRLFKDVEDLKNPEKDEVEVIDL